MSTHSKQAASAQGNGKIQLFHKTWKDNFYFSDVNMAAIYWSDNEKMSNYNKKMIKAKGF